MNDSYKKGLSQLGTAPFLNKNICAGDDKEIKKKEDGA